ncbi:MAG: 30S ribosome-binding factor RbfA [Anaerolineae bacterium]|jgi:ribosome-binding factor A
MPTRRQRRVSELIHRELSLLLLHEARDPRLVDVTITDVDITRDLLLAHVYFTVLGSKEEEQHALDGLEHAKGYLRTGLANRIQLRFIPDLSFHVDKSVEYGRRIDALLDQLNESGQLDDEQTPA